jgi:hypothetical protein
MSKHVMSVIITTLFKSLSGVVGIYIYVYIYVCVCIYIPTPRWEREGLASRIVIPENRWSRGQFHVPATLPCGKERSSHLHMRLGFIRRADVEKKSKMCGLLEVEIERFRFSAILIHKNVHFT